MEFVKIRSFRQVKMLTHVFSYLEYKGFRLVKRFAERISVGKCVKIMVGEAPRVRFWGSILRIMMC